MIEDLATPSAVARFSFHGGALKFTDPADRWQWRTTFHRPNGEWIDSRAPLKRRSTAEGTQVPDPQSEGFRMSSFDLLNGLDVSEADEEVLSQFDQLFPPEVNPKL